LAFMFSCSDNIGSSSDADSNSTELSSQEALLALMRDNRLYLGRGYDVIHSSYINRADVIRNFPVLDQEKMIRDGLIVSEPIPGQQVFQTFTGTSMAEFYSNRNASINAGLSMESKIRVVLFSGKFDTEFRMRNGQC
jgi:hypothetical protein